MISVLAVVIAAELIVAIFIEEVAIGVYEATVCIHIEAILVVDTTDRVAFLSACSCCGPCSCCGGDLGVLGVAGVGVLAFDVGRVAMVLVVALASGLRTDLHGTA